MSDMDEFNENDESNSNKPAIMVNMGLMDCKECEKNDIRQRAFNAFDWSKVSKVIGYNKETKTITVDEEKLMRLIILVNPAQKERPIELIKKQEA